MQHIDNTKDVYKAKESLWTGVEMNSLITVLMQRVTRICNVYMYVLTKQHIE